MMNEKKQTISIVISLYNEEEGIRHFWKVLQNALVDIPHIDFELIWVNDGSLDKTQSLIDEIQSSNRSTNIRNISIEFSRNYGHEAAMIAGIDSAKSDAIICMDSDLQHPPEKIPDMIKAFESGTDIVLTNRLSRNDNGFFKKLLTSLFYKVINLLSENPLHENATDFFLISKQISEILQSDYRERNRFIRGFIQTIGFNKTMLEFEAPDRAFGRSNYTYKHLFKLALNAIFSFSNKPLRLSILASAVSILFTLTLGGYSLFMYLFGDSPPSGYTTIIIFLSLSFTVLFVLITILSIYFEKTISEARQRPIYIIKRKLDA